MKTLSTYLDSGGVDDEDRPHGIQNDHQVKSPYRAGAQLPIN